MSYRWMTEWLHIQWSKKVQSSKKLEPEWSFTKLYVAAATNCDVPARSKAKVPNLWESMVVLR